MNIDLTGKRALVTGGGGGIGEACVHALATAGAHVYVNDLQVEATERVAKLAEGTAVAGDVADPSTWVDPILKHPLHVLVHCAGFDSETPVEAGATATFDSLINTFLRGPFELTSQLLPALTEANGAAVIFISSVQGFQTYPNQAGYAGSKAGQVGMVKSLSLELGPLGIRVLAVSPGYIHTRLMQAWANTTLDPEATLADANNLHPLGRMGQPKDVASLVTFLASPLAEFINGTNIVIDGGLAAKYP